MNRTTFLLETWDSILALSSLLPLPHPFPASFWSSSFRLPSSSPPLFHCTTPLITFHYLSLWFFFPQPPFTHSSGSTNKGNMTTTVTCLIPTLQDGGCRSLEEWVLFPLQLHTGPPAFSYSSRFLQSNLQNAVWTQGALSLPGMVSPNSTPTSGLLLHHTHCTELCHLLPSVLMHTYNRST